VTNMSVLADDADLAEVTRRVGQSKTSFYAAMRVLPKARRNAMFAIYAFCRDVDDIADEPAPQSVKQRELDLWRQEIASLYNGLTPSKPLARALIEPIRLYDLQRADFMAVIDGMQMDADRDIRAPSLEELDLYCARVAGAVGRLSVRVFGPWQPESDQVADHLGRALQLTNILRDLDEDAARGRLYLPRELLLRHGIYTEDPTQVITHPALAGLCAELVAMAEARFAAADAAMRLCARSAMRPAAMMGAVYRAQLERLKQRGWAAPRAPIKLPKLLKLWIAFRSGYL